MELARARRADAVPSKQLDWKMRLNRPLLKLPIGFCAETLAAEIRALPESAWLPHPNRIPGNDAVPLVTPGGRITDRFEGPMAPTEHLLKCPSITQAMAEIGGVWGRSRLMGLGPGAQVPAHVDINYYWRTHLRIHIPIITNPGVLFTCGEETVHMAPGEAWVFDSFRMHNVQNRGTEKRIHLVLDTVPGEELWSLIDEAQGTGAPSTRPVKRSEPAERPIDRLFFEQLNTPGVMSPWELRCHIAFIRELVVPHGQVEPVFKRLDRFAQGWASVWARFGDSGDGTTEYQRLIAEVKRDLQPLGAAELVLSNEVPVNVALQEMIFVFGGARDSGDKTVQPGSAGAARSGQAEEPHARDKVISAAPAFTTLIERPIFVVNTPRSGSTLLFQMLMLAPGAYTVRGESHQLIESVPGLHPEAKGWSSNRLTEADADPATVEKLSAVFHAALRDRVGREAAGPVRMIEKTPKNSLRVPFFKTAYPDAYFLYLYRDARQTLSSMMEAWASRRFRTYPDLPGWPGDSWSLLLVPGWRELTGLTFPEIVAHQWATTTRILLDDLEQVAPERVRAVSFAEFLDDPQATMRALCTSLGLQWDQLLPRRLPPSPAVVSAPSPDKWRRNEQVIESVWPIMEEQDARARAFLERMGSMAEA
ncbi:MAG TPA: sulfotransferase [Allosphingosinicella sp.]|nr:sulfotransferase [Allosphingosinicella sp.]